VKSAYAPRPRCSSLFLFVLASLSPLGLMRLTMANPTANFVVTTTSGQLRGVSRSTGGAEFLGIPFAQPPVGDLRWHEPVAAKSWSGIRDAAAFGAPCAQPVLGDWNKHDAETSQEDCLYLNVFTPVWPPKAPLPVMFWLHGGANVGGTASSALYKDGTLPQHGVVLVTVNYRLGIFGFLAHPELTRESSHHASGNYGLMDQIAALRWVRENISKFGGDPANITVFGQSAGAQDTGLLMTSPLSKFLFQRAIAESGTAYFPPPQRLSEAEQTGEKLAATWKAPAGEGAIKFLRQLSAQGLLKDATSRDADRPPTPGPVIDGWVLVRSPAALFAAGQQSAIPMLIGSTTREFGGSSSPEELRIRIQGAAGSFAPQMLALYGLANGGQGTADPKYGSVANQVAADSFFRCPVTTQAAWHAAVSHPTYEYQFAHAIPGQEAQGAMHSGDLPYVFGFFPKTGNIAGNFGELDHKLADLMESYWTNFAKTGNPNGANLPNWPEFDGTQSYLEFTKEGAAVANSGGLRKPQCDLYREILKERMSRRQTAN
jgi:para-nitrobenzyl esterase